MLLSSKLTWFLKFVYIIHMNNIVCPKGNFVLCFCFEGANPCNFGEFLPCCIILVQLSFVGVLYLKEFMSVFRLKADVSEAC